MLIKFGNMELSFTNINVTNTGIGKFLVTYAERLFVAKIEVQVTKLS